MSDETTVEHHPTVSGVLHGGEHLCLVFYDRRDTKVVRLNKDERLVVGRSHPADVVIADPSLSRSHAAVEWTDDGVFIEDLGSTNGVSVAGAKVERTRLQAGVPVALGVVTASLHVTAARGQGLEGLVTHDDFLSRAREEIARSRQFGRNATVAFIRAVGKEAHVEKFVPRLRSELRDVDRLSVYGKDAVLILMPEQASVDSLAAIRSLVQPRLGEPEMRAGVAVFPEDGATGEALLVSARTASREASASNPAVSPSRAVKSEEPLVVSEAMREVYAAVDRVAASSLSVLIVGETGSGKELVARAIHRRSGARSQGPMCSVNCGALTESLLQSALFGHLKGSFTGADADREGLFERASGGTLFLDEVGELSLSAQAALLRVLETRRVSRVGSTEEIPVDVRIVAATHRDLRARVEEGAFREDLVYRIEGFAIQVPALKERREEIGPLAERFLAQAAFERGAALELSAEALVTLRAYDWPGNVRELRNAIERAAVICATETVEASDLPDRVRGGSQSVDSRSSGTPADDGRTFKEQIKDYELDLILNALEAAEGNQTQAAKALGMPLRTLVHKIRSYGIKKKFDRG